MTDGTPPTATRGDATREALIAAALELFGRHGYDGTSHRALAQASEVNSALIGYHFGGKHGLYLAVFEHLARELRARLHPTAEAVAGLLAQEPPAGRRELLDGVLTITDRFVQVMTSPETSPWARLIIREQQDPTEALDILYDGFMARLIGILSALVARLQGVPDDAAGARLTAMTIVGQALLFRTAHAAVLRTLGWQSFGPAEIAAIQARIRTNVTAMLLQENFS